MCRIERGKAALRTSHQMQRNLMLAPIDHPIAKELEAVSRILDSEPTLAELVAQDLVPAGKRCDRGAPGMTGNQALRAAVVKQMNGYSYAQLTFHLADSATYQRFCGFGLAESPPGRSTLAENIKRIRPQTWEAINRTLAHVAQDVGIESGERARMDCTVVLAPILSPTDGGLLWDTVRVVSRTLVRAMELCPKLQFGDPSKKAKRCAYDVFYARSAEKRRPHYDALIQIAIETLEGAQASLPTLRESKTKAKPNGRRVRKLAKLLATLERHIPLGWQVVEQTFDRVVQETPVPAAEKVVSIFEEHTDIIVKDRRETLFGHKICLNVGPSSFVTDCQILDGNPADSTLVENMLQRHREIHGAAPKQAAFDGGFASKANVAIARAQGVTDICFSKKRGIDIADMASSHAVYRTLKRFRAGVEGCISFLKRSFGMDRCTWKSESSFASYVWLSVVACNLLVLARHILD
jgi:transposase, IS5 family